MASSGINFKVFLHNLDSVEVKRFCVDPYVVTSLFFMKEKLISVFPILRDNEFKITWKDSDGDDITVSCDEDFITALTEMIDITKVLYVTIANQNQSHRVFDESPRAVRVVCDICQKGITGYRYKCIECVDYDLCSSCENEGHHSEHLVLRLPNSDTPFAKLDRKFMYQAAKALKRSACSAARDAHRFTREASRNEKERCHKNRQGTSSEKAYGCPWSAGADEPIKDAISQHLNPLLEIFSKGAGGQSNQSQDGGYLLTDVIRSAVDAFFGHPQGSSENHQQPQQQPSQPQPQPEQQPDAEVIISSNSSSSSVENQEMPSEKQVEASAPPTEIIPTQDVPQEMDWTIVNSNNQEIEKNVENEKKIQPPAPPQDPRLMRGLAQLYEMGFSNENHFLNFLLEQNGYDVSKVVKAILELR